MSCLDNDHHLVPATGDQEPEFHLQGGLPGVASSIRMEGGSAGVTSIIEMKSYLAGITSASAKVRSGWWDARGLGQREECDRAGHQAGLRTMSPQPSPQGSVLQLGWPMLHPGGLSSCLRCLSR